MVLGYLGNIIGPRDPNSTVKKVVMLTLMQGKKY